MPTGFRQFLADLLLDETAAPPVFDSAPEAPLVLPETLRLRGDLVMEGDVLLHARFEGNLSAHRVYVAPNAEIRGLVVAEEVEVHGRIDGEIYARRIVARPTARIDGDLVFTTFAIDAGAYFEGGTHRTDDPRRVARERARHYAVAAGAA